MYDTTFNYYKSLIHYNEKNLKIVKYEDFLGNQIDSINLLLINIHGDTKQIFSYYNVDSAYFFVRFPDKFVLLE